MQEDKNSIEPEGQRSGCTGECFKCWEMECSKYGEEWEE